MKTSRRTEIDGDTTLADAIAILETEIADRIRLVTGLKELCREARHPSTGYSGIGRPKKYPPSVEENVVALIAGGKTHRAIAAELNLPVSTVGKMAKRGGSR
jgi:DNA-binding NarL/FixJ family response regulator